jgi:hypothetical protein
LARLAALDDKRIAGTPCATNYQNCQNPSLSVLSVDREGDAAGILIEQESGAGQPERAVRARARLLRWGWPTPEADAMAERLARHDADDRVSCAGECAHYRPGRCGNHRLAGLQSADVGRDFAGLLQRCPGFQSGGDVL